MQDGRKAVVQNPSSTNFDNSWSDFFFVIDTCEHLSPITKRTDCKTEAESQQVLESIYASTKIQTAFWNTKNYLRNGKALNSEFATNEVQLNSAVFQRQAYQIRTNAITFYNNRWINIPYMPKVQAGEKIQAFDISSSFNTIYPVSSKAKLPAGTADNNPQNTYFSIKF